MLLLLPRPGGFLRARLSTRTPAFKEERRGKNEGQEEPASRTALILVTTDQLDGKSAYRTSAKSDPI
jgi:hypothetical protein